MKLAALGAFVILRPLLDEPGAIIIPDAAKQVPWKATVVSVGPDVDDVEEGDTVVFRYGAVMAVIAPDLYAVKADGGLVAVVTDDDGVIERVPVAHTN